MMKHTIHSIALFFVFFLAANAQEDAYHQWLRAQLASQYNINGGAWLLGATENAAFDQVYVTPGVTRTDQSVTTQPFVKAIRLKTTSRPANSWDHAAYISFKSSAQKGDALLLIVWIRSVSAESGNGVAISLIGENQSPYRESVSRLQLPSGEWQQHIIPLTASIDLPNGVGQYGIQIGMMSQEIEFGGLAVLNFGTSIKASDLPQSTFHLDYAGREPNAAWRAQAQARIEQYRKGDIKVRVVDALNKPIVGATVQVEMQKHAFGFGTAISEARMIGTSAEDRTYRQKLENINGDGRSFNLAVLENGLKWTPWEGVSGWYPLSRAQTVEVATQLRQKGMKVRGHTLIWPSWQYMPADIEQNKTNPSYVWQRVDDHITQEAGYDSLKGKLVHWDVLNEPAHLYDLADIFGRDKIHEEYARWFNLAAQVDPLVALYINDYDIIAEGGVDLNTQDRYFDVIQKIKTAGGKIDGIGVQGHFSTPVTPPAHVFAILERYSTLIPQLAVTEYDLANAPDSLAADYLRDLLTICYSHPAVQNFLMWGFWDNSHWKSDAPLFRSDWSLKPSGRAFLNLVFKDWWTQLQGNTGNDGSFSSRGFLGQYEITATMNNVTATKQITLKSGTNEIELKLNLPTDVTDFDAPPDAIRLDQNYPNPFGGAANASKTMTTIRFQIPQASHVKLTVLDPLGRIVATLMDENLRAGLHQTHFYANDLPSGIYFYRLETDRYHASRLMTIMR